MLVPPGLAAKLLGISYPTLRRWILAGRIAARKTPGGRYLVPDSEILRLLASDQLWLNVVRAQSLPRRVKLSDALGRGVDVQLMERVGLATEYDGSVVFKECLDQPVRVIEKLLPSLLSLKHGAGFRGDVEVARKEVKGFVTLDYAAYELTGYQIPRTLYLYPEDLEGGKRRLKELGFEPSPVSEADVVLLPRFGAIDQYRVHLDSLARGGRSTLDALAVELLRPEMVAVEARYPAEMVRKVVEDLRAMRYGRDLLRSEVARIAELLGDKVISVGAVAVLAYLGWRHRATHDIDIALVSLKPSDLLRMGFREFKGVPVHPLGLQGGRLH